MTGWRADYRTNPRTWRRCAHPFLEDGRCFDCKAKPVEYHKVPGKTVGGHLLSSNYVIPNPRMGLLGGDGGFKAAPFNPQFKKEAA